MKFLSINAIKLIRNNKKILFANNHKIFVKNFLEIIWIDICSKLLLAVTEATVYKGPEGKKVNNASNPEDKDDTSQDISNSDKEIPSIPLNQ